MKKIICFILSLFLIITTGSAKGEEDDKFTTTLYVTIKKSIYTQIGGGADLDFVVRDDTIFVDGEQLFSLLGFKVEIDNGELAFRNYKSTEYAKLEDNTPFWNRNISGSFSTRSNTFYLSYIFPGLEKFKAPAKSIALGEKIYIPFSFVLDVFNLKLDTSTMTIRSTDLSKLDVMLDAYDYMKYKYIFGQNYSYGLGWEGIYKGSDSRLNAMHNFLIGYINNYLDGKYLENLRFEKESINKLTDRMLTYKSLNAIDSTSRILKNVTGGVDRIGDVKDYAKAFYNIKVPEEDFSEFIDLAGKEVDIINSVLKIGTKTEDLLQQTAPYTAEAIQEYFTSTYNSDIKNSYTDFMKDFEKNIVERTKVDLDRTTLYEINFADKLINKAIGKTKGFGEDKIQDLSLKALIKAAKDKGLPEVNDKVFKKAFKNVLNAQKLGLKLGHEAIKKVFEKDISASESYTLSSYSILLSKMVSHDFYRAYLKLGANREYDKRYTDEGFDYLNNAMYMSLLSTFTSMDLMDDHLSVFKDMKNRKSYFSTEKERITELMGFFEFAKDEKISKVIFNKEKNKDFLKSNDDTKLIELLSKKGLRKNPPKEYDEEIESDGNNDLSFLGIYKDMLESKKPYRIERFTDGDINELFIKNIIDKGQISFAFYDSKAFTYPLLMIKNTIDADQNKSRIAIVQYMGKGKYITFSDLAFYNPAIPSKGIYKDRDGNLYMDNYDTGDIYAIRKVGKYLNAIYGYTRGYCAPIYNENYNTLSRIQNTKGSNGTDGLYKAIKLNENKKMDFTEADFNKFKNSLEEIEFYTYSSEEFDRLASKYRNLDAKSRSELSGGHSREEFEEYIKSNIGLYSRDGKTYVFIADYDNNGKLSAYAIGDAADDRIKLYYIDENLSEEEFNIAYESYFGFADPELIKAGNDDYLLLKTVHTTYLKSYLLSVEDNKIYQPTISGQVDDFIKKGDKFVNSYTYLKEVELGSVRTEAEDNYDYDQESREFYKN